MRVYNGTNSQVDLPLSGNQRITIPSHSVSGDIMPSNEFLSLLVGSYDYSELALIVSGPFEINMCAGVSGCVGFVCQSLEEAIERFAEKEVKEEKVVDNSSTKEEVENNETATTGEETKEVTNTVAAENNDQPTTVKKRKAKSDKKIEEN